MFYLSLLNHGWFTHGTKHRRKLSHLCFVHLADTRNRSHVCWNYFWDISLKQMPRRHIMWLAYFNFQVTEWKNNQTEVLQVPQSLSGCQEHIFHKKKERKKKEKNNKQTKNVFPKDKIRSVSIEIENSTILGKWHSADILMHSLQKSLSTAHCQHCQSSKTWQKCLSRYYKIGHWQSVPAIKQLNNIIL